MTRKEASCGSDHQSGRSTYHKDASEVPSSLPESFLPPHLVLSTVVQESCQCDLVNLLVSGVQDIGDKSVKNWSGGNIFDQGILYVVLGNIITN